MILYPASLNALHLSAPSGLSVNRWLMKCRFRSSRWRICITVLAISSVDCDCWLRWSVPRWLWEPASDASAETTLDEDWEPPSRKRLAWVRGREGLSCGEGKGDILARGCSWEEGELLSTRVWSWNCCDCTGRGEDCRLLTLWNVSNVREGSCLVRAEQAHSALTGAWVSTPPCSSLMISVSVRVWGGVP